MMRKIYILLIAVATATTAVAQSDRALVRQGNRSYRHRNFTEAETCYRKSLSQNRNNATAAYNLGRTLQAQNKDKDALAQYETAARKETDRKRKAMSYHNMGTIYQKQKKLDKAVDAYKKALINNPNDNETRYNLALCMRQQQQQQKNKNQGGGKNNKNKKNQNKNDKNKNNNNKNNNNQNKQQPKPQNNMSRDNAEQMLNAALQEEQDAQKRLQKAMRQPARRQNRQNW